MKKSLKIVGLAFVFFGWFPVCFIACNNSKGAASQEKTSEVSGTVKKIISVPDKLNVLYLTESEFLSLVGTDSPNAAEGKLSFQFALPGNYSTDNPDRLTLAVWPSKGGRYHGAHKQYLHNEIIKQEQTLDKKDILGGQKLINTDVQKIKDQLLAQGSPNNQVVAFKPKKDGNKVSYLIAVFNSLSDLEKSPLLWPPPIAETNPSPPAGDDPNHLSPPIDEF